MIVRRPAALALTLGLCACSIDQRPLSLASGDDGMAGAFAAGESGAGGLAAGGAAGAGSMPGDLVDGCADLDTDGVADCEDTLVESPTFTTDVSGWLPTGNATLTWDPKNALTDLPSGSAKLTLDTLRASAIQCVRLSGEQLVIAYASAFVEPASDADDPGQAAIEVSFFESEDCSGDSHGFFETPPSAAANEWTTIQAGSLASAPTSSIAVALVGIKADSAAELNVYFDNVMLKAQLP